MSDDDRLKEYQSALAAIFNHPNINLGDLVYTVRERNEGDWDAPPVKAWGDAVVECERILKRDGLLK